MVHQVIILEEVREEQEAVVLEVQALTLMVSQKLIVLLVQQIQEAVAEVLAAQVVQVVYRLLVGS